MECGRERTDSTGQESFTSPVIDCGTRSCKAHCEGCTASCALNYKCVGGHLPLVGFIQLQVYNAKESQLHFTWYQQEMLPAAALYCSCLHCPPYHSPPAHHLPHSLNSCQIHYWHFCSSGIRLALPNQDQLSRLLEQLVVCPRSNWRK